MAIEGNGLLNRFDSNAGHGCFDQLMQGPVLLDYAGLHLVRFWSC